MGESPYSIGGKKSDLSLFIRKQSSRLFARKHQTTYRQLMCNLQQTKKGM